MLLSAVRVLVVAAVCLAPSAAHPEDAQMAVLFNEKTRLYHVPGCSLLHTKVAPVAMSIRDASSRGLACSACCPLCALERHVKGETIENVKASIAQAITDAVIRAASDAATGLGDEVAAPVADSGAPDTGSTASSAPSTGSASGSGYVGGGTSSADKTVRVKGYRRKDGTYVEPHTRRAPRKK